MVLVIDNYDSFTYNLVQYLGEMNVEMQVHRNDQLSVDQVRTLNPDRLLISPGPCSPKESGLSNEIIRTFSKEVPVFGVCLGHQCIGHTFGAEVVVNYRMMHGKTSLIKHNGKDLFKDMKHALRNAVIPVVTLLGTQLPQIIGGTVIIETVFGLPGMSRFLFDAINQRDYPVIQGVNLVVISLIVLINLTIDALYAVLDPRIRY